ncbi:MAG TPA: SusC/RagA family TonB-linked outer membrane protein, partial [Chitinophagaceae bacterium]|nr:SusC/RagA family TonB-linked outer membrane protein [Chitinophagaceae bacterium]
ESFNLGVRTLYSMFGRFDYSYKGKYLVNGTLRRDGYSGFGAANRFGTFPSVGAAWRVSEEAFMKDVSWINDLKLRASWGELGSISAVDPFNQYTTFVSDPTRSWYDIGGANNSASQGYIANRQGNDSTKWETTVSKNLGIDLTLLQGKWTFSADVFRNDTRDLLVPRQRIALEPIVTQPSINIGTMRNDGFEFALGNRGNITSDLSYNVNFAFTKYKNEIIKVNEEGSEFNGGVDRLNNVLVTKKGLPISSFIGYNIVGFYNNASDTAKGPKINGATPVIGSYRFQDVDGDNNITSADRVILGSPHPDFQLSTNIELNYKNFDFTAFLFWNQGNEIFNNTKYFTDFRVFVGGVSTRVLEDSWTPETAGSAKLPRLGNGAENGYTGFVTGNSNSYYVEDGSFFRAKTVQLGYTLPRSIAQRIKLSSLRVYAQAQNLFTITNYTGADPDVSLFSNSGNDRGIGVDRGGFPNPKMFLLGLNVNF